MAFERSLKRVAATACLVAGACLPTDAPTGPMGMPVSVAPTMSLIPSPGDATAKPINRLRAVVRGTVDDVERVAVVEDVAPTDASWTLAIDVPLEGAGLQVGVYLYLIHVSPAGVEEVQFSGFFGPITLVPGGAPVSPDVPIVRGPPENLLTTAVTITSAPQAIRVGESAVFTGQAETTASVPPTVFWTSSDTTILRLAGAVATGVGVGSAQVVASAGAFADTALVSVLPPDTTPPVVVSTVPADGATDVGLVAPIVVLFDEELAAATVNAASFVLRDSLGGQVPATVTYASQAASLRPDVVLDTLHRYTASVSGSVADVAGNALGAAYTFSFTTAAGAVLLDTVDPGLGLLTAIAHDPRSGNLFVYDDFAAVIHEMAPDGTLVPPAIPIQGSASNDIDLEFLPLGTTIGGTQVPTNTLLIYNGESSIGELYAVDKDDGTLLASVTTQIGHQTVGGAFHPGRGTFFGVNWVTDRIYEMSALTGDTLSSFPAEPAGSPGFTVFYGDIDVVGASGNILVVSSDQPVLRVMSPTGAWIRDVDLTPLDVAGMSGIAWDDATGTAWISSTNGSVYHLEGIPPS